MINKKLLSSLFIISVIIFLIGCAAPEKVIEEPTETEQISSEITEVDTLDEELGQEEVEQELDELEEFLEQI